MDVASINHVVRADAEALRELSVMLSLPLGPASRFENVLLQRLRHVRAASHPQRCLLDVLDVRQGHRHPSLRLWLFGALWDRVQEDTALLSRFLCPSSPLLRRRLCSTSARRRSSEDSQGRRSRYDSVGNALRHSCRSLVLLARQG